MDNEILLTRHDLCRRLKITPRTLNLWVKSGKAPPRLDLPSGAIRYRQSDVEKWESGYIADSIAYIAPRRGRPVKDA